MQKVRKNALFVSKCLVMSNICCNFAAYFAPKRA